MNENGGSQPSTAPAVPDASRPVPVMDVVRRPLEAPAQRADIAPPPEVMQQIAPHPAPKHPIRDMELPVADSKPDDLAHEKSEPPAQTELKEPPAETESAPEDPEKPIRQDHHAAKKAAKAEPAAKPVKQTKHSSGITGAIVGTVVIVIALASLVVYAYLQSK